MAKLDRQFVRIGRTGDQSCCLIDITWVFFSQQLCLLFGSTFGGVFKKRVKESLFVLLLSSFLISVVFAIIPFCYNVGFLALVMAIAGLAMGCIDTISNMQLVKIYQQDSAVFLQVLHFFVGFGAFLSPMIADPFLSDTNCILSNATNNVSDNLEDIRNSLVPHHPGNVSHYALPLNGHSVTKVSYAFWIIATINLPVPIAVFYLLYKQGMLPGCSSHKGALLSADELAMENCTQGDVKKVEVHKEDGHDVSLLCCWNKTLRNAPYTFFAIHTCAAVTLFMTDGIVGEFSGFVYTYAVDQPLSLVHKTAGYLPSLFWAFITLGRLISIPLSYRISPRSMLIINLIGITATFLMLMLLRYSVPGLFIGTALLGLFLSSVYPSMLAYAEDMLNYKGCATTVLVTGAAMGEMVLQMLVGSVMDYQGSYSFLVCGVILSCLALVFFAVLLVVDRLHHKKLKDLPPKVPEYNEEIGSYQR
ncbi:hypothetical protein GDO86_003425 [Hymenochirus boettgeri]|uniref:Major facilitator superfamily domain-containing protein 4A n=1 Tax=Hymenochirus boettgeri TaxID=247094 RepID=A0A8T2K5P5_9PIPI|nr:hypothetical protein GDO86_003425 [Hymenochirus boettgeri]